MNCGYIAWATMRLFRIENDEYGNRHKTLLKQCESRENLEALGEIIANAEQDESSEWLDLQLPTMGDDKLDYIMRTQLTLSLRGEDYLLIVA